jgi:hypothetical protein
MPSGIDRWIMLDKNIAQARNSTWLHSRVGGSLRKQELQRRRIRYQDSAKAARWRRSLTINKKPQGMLRFSSACPQSSRQATDRQMQNVVQFRKPNDGFENLGVESRSSAAHAVPPMPAQNSETGTLCAKAKEDVRSLILMFDVALMHGRLAILKMDDPETRQRLEAHLRAIEEMLDLARFKAARL